MTAGQTHQDQFQQLRTRNMADELHLHDHMSDRPLTQDTQFSGEASMTDGEFQGKCIHFNVLPKSDEIDPNERLANPLCMK